MHYQWKASTGNLDYRTDNIHGLTENFQYDDADRLTDWQVDGLDAYTIDYATNGNIDSKTGTGTYVYDNLYLSKPHAVDKIKNPTDAISTDRQDIIYTSFHKPSQITQDEQEYDEEYEHKLEFRYGPENNRKKTVLYQDDQPVRTRIFAGNYEKEINLMNGNVKEFNYISGPNGLIAVYIVMNGTGTLYYTVTDHLGSIIQLIDKEGNLIEETNYSPWGRYRNPETWEYDNTAGLSLIHRGFTGHEMLPEFGLINMNGRLYDPVLGRMLSPDNYMQDPTNPQNYNRYSYCNNNPLKYTDPDGEFFVIDSWIIGLFSGGWNEANKRAWNDIKIWGGLFASDPNKSFGGRVWETVSRFTWQLPQTIGGWGTSQACNTLGLKGGVESVKYKYGATVVSTQNSWYGAAVTQGSYIVGGSELQADPNNSLFQHEYGHYIQSQSMGWAYYPRVGIPSLLSKGEHDFHPVEQDANRRAFLYFNKNIDGFYDINPSDNKGWDFYYNPIDPYQTGTYGLVWDYKNARDLQTIDKLTVHTKWYDHFSWLLFPIGPIGVGLINSGYYNRNY